MVSENKLRHLYKDHEFIQSLLDNGFKFRGINASFDGKGEFTEHRVFFRRRQFSVVCHLTNDTVGIAYKDKDAEAQWVLTPTRIDFPTFLAVWNGTPETEKIKPLEVASTK